MAGIRPGTGECVSDPKYTNHKTPQPFTCWAAKVRVAGGSDSDHPREAHEAAQREIRVYNRVKGMREESRPAGPAGRRTRIASAS